jgi:hypothetical protein
MTVKCASLSETLCNTFNMHSPEYRPSPLCGDKDTFKVVIFLPDTCFSRDIPFGEILLSNCSAAREVRRLEDNTGGYAIPNAPPLSSSKVYVDVLSFWTPLLFIPFLILFPVCNGSISSTSTVPLRCTSIQVIKQTSVRCKFTTFSPYVHRKKAR